MLDTALDVLIVLYKFIQFQNVSRTLLTTFEFKILKKVKNMNSASAYIIINKAIKWIFLQYIKV